MTPPAPPIRLLFVNRMAGLERGGGETFDLEMARALALRGFHVSFLTSAPLLHPPPCPLPKQFHPHYLHTPWLQHFPWDEIRGGWRVHAAEFALFEYRAARFLRHAHARFDVIQICELPTLLFLLRKCRFPTPISLRLTAPNYYDPHHALPLADLLIASGTSIPFLSQQGLPNLHNIPNGVDTSRFSPGANPAFRAAHHIPDNAFLSIYTARFQAFKNHALLLDAFAILRRHCPNAHLLLIGTGPLLPRAKARAAALHLSPFVTFLGNVPHHAIPDACRAADLCAISSHYESFCFAALESMATGLPVLTTDCGWVPHLIRGGCGLVVPRPSPHTPTSPQDYANAWIHLAKNPRARAAMGRAARAKTLAHYTWTASAARLASLYANLLHPKPHTPTPTPKTPPQKNNGR